MASEKRILIYQAVLDLLCENYDAAEITISSIAKKAGIGKGTVYEYFSSKEDIFFEALMFFADHKIDALARALEQEGSFRERFGRMLPLLCDTLLSGRSLMNLLFSSQDGPRPALPAPWLEKKAQAQAQILQILQRFIRFGQQEGLLEEEIGQADVFFAFSAVLNIVHVYLLGGCEPLTEQLDTQEHMMDFCYQKFLKLLGRPAAFPQPS